MLSVQREIMTKRRRRTKDSSMNSTAGQPEPLKATSTFSCWSVRRKSLIAFAFVAIAALAVSLSLTLPGESTSSKETKTKPSPGASIVPVVHAQFLHDKTAFT
jgi:hypothetical protein